MSIASGERYPRNRAGRADTYAIRQAAVRCFDDPLPEWCVGMLTLTPAKWRALLRWLDVSGLALYFLDRLIELQLTSLLPAAVLDRLQQNLSDNALRMRDLQKEFLSINHEFQRAGLSYAAVKGFALPPASVPKPNLRSQLDLDFIISPESARYATRILQAEGYRLHAVSENNWEFKADQAAGVSLTDMYKPSRGRCVELHLEADAAGTRLARRVMRNVHGAAAPVLAEADQFIDQGMHVYKHIIRDFFRISHLLEFRRHVESRRQDEDFWEQVRAEAAKHARTGTGLGVAIALVSHLQGDFVPRGLSAWTVESIPSDALLWIRPYGSRLPYADFPGTKLQLMLQDELPRTALTSGAGRRQLIPRRLPPRVLTAPEGESAVNRWRRLWFEGQFIVLRLKFHCVEGVRYLVEKARWRRYKRRVKSDAAIGHTEALPFDARVPKPQEVADEQVLNKGMTIP